MADVEAIPHLRLVVARQLAPQKGGDMSRFDGMNQGFQERRVKSLQRLLTLEDHIGRKFSLHDCPAIGQVQGLDHRAVTLGQLIQLGLQGLGVEVSRQLIGRFKVGNVHQSVVHDLKRNPFSFELLG